ncbi:hypothetical protein GCM10010912_59350 [Paenibacillus albidus]|uniref:Uncharacterized protein n=1 Tax=Paenibacillus albidus TaxID=2041023 RepID=A0A917D394_9BACL|nr:hypothetical protein [Paenibacillus albidus]GGG06813.1 hypothetical protein GCM10010912_59350 [Paenibacillus albidus]
MSVQQLRASITAALELYFPDVPVYEEGEKPQQAYFQPALISATYDRQRQDRYLAVYRFGIRYEQGSPLDAEAMADRLSEALTEMEDSYRMVRQAWEAGTDGRGPLVTVDYMLYLQREAPDAVKMGHMAGGERLK